MKEYLPPALRIREYTSASIIGKLGISKTMKNLSKGELLFTSLRTKLDLESLPVLFLIRVHYEVLSALDKSRKIIESMTKPLDSGQPKMEFALMREIRKNRAFHIDLLNGPLYAHLLEEALKTDFDDLAIFEKVQKRQP